MCPPRLVFPFYRSVIVHFREHQDSVFGIHTYFYFSPPPPTHTQSLLVLNYLILNGSERVVTSAREHIYDMKSLEEYTFRDDHGKDQGINGTVFSLSDVSVINSYLILFLAGLWQDMLQSCLLTFYTMCIISLSKQHSLVCLSKTLRSYQ